MVALRSLLLYTWQYDVDRSRTVVYSDGPRPGTAYDYLTVGSTQFKGVSGPNGFKMSKGDELFWTSDGSGVKEGWKVCTMKGPG